MIGNETTINQRPTDGDFSNNKKYGFFNNYKHILQQAINVHWIEMKNVKKILEKTNVVKYNETQNENHMR